MAIGRPREFDRDLALQAAMDVFWRKGFLTASMNDLCEAMGIRSPSLYAAFGSKEALYLEAVAHYVKTVGTPIWGRLAEGATARAGVEALLRAAARRLPAGVDVPAGCMVTLGALGEETPDAVAASLRAVRSDGLQQLRLRLRGAVASGELPASANVERLSRFYLAVYQGLAVQARDGATSAELKGVVDLALAAWPGG